MGRQTDLAWAAGFLDGEGCFYSQRNRRGDIQVKISAVQKYRPVLEKLHELLGGRIDKRVDGNWIWMIDSARLVVETLPLFQRYLVGKANQADLMMQLCNNIRSGDRPIDHALRDRLVAEMRAAKRYGEPKLVGE